MKLTPKLLVPIGIAAIGVLGVVVISATRREVQSEAPVATAPLVSVVTARPQQVAFVVRAHGTVKPRTESELVPQVSGTVVWVSPALASGGFFDEGDPLVRIDRADYEVALESARAAVARTRSEFERAQKDLDRQKRLAKQSIASAARYDEAVNTERIAAAALREARAALERAESDLARTEIRAPYAGRVREEKVDVGQFVSRGAAIATIYAVDTAEVRLPIPDSELRFLDLPLLYRGEMPETGGPKVRLHARFAGGDYSWDGRIVRSEGEIDARSRMVNVVAQVEDPYGRSEPPAGGGPDGDDRPPLAVGLFVEAEIAGRTIDDAFVLPREALRGSDRVLVVADDDRAHFREVDVLRRERDTVIVDGGLAAGDRVVVTPLSAAVDGMAVRIEGDPSAAAVADESADGGGPAPEGNS